MSSTQQQFKIRIGALRRNLKDLAYCHADLDKERKRLEEEPDADKRLQLAKVVSECQQMLPHNESRVQKSAHELREFMDNNEDELRAVDGSMEAEFAEAEQLLRNAARD